MHEDRSMRPVVVGERIPDDIVIQCPAVRFEVLMAAQHCTGCAFFNGVALLNSDAARPWQLRHAIRCMHPIERRVKSIIFQEMR